MFFYIGNKCELLKQVRPKLFLDDGWKEQNNIYYKGYSTECNLQESLYKIIEGYKPRGIYAIIYNDKIYHSNLRGFPIYTNGFEFTNIPNYGCSDFIPTNIEWDTNFSVYDSINVVVDKCLKILEENIRGFIQYNPNVKLNVIATGGVDSTLVWAMLSKISSFNLSVTKRSIKEYRSELTDYMANNHWAYKAINLNKETVYNITGFSAEVMTIRGYDMFNFICQAIGQDVYKLLQKNDYMYYFLQRDNIYTKLKNNTYIPNELHKDLLSMINHDYYIWHIDNNFHFSPFYDERFPKACIKLSIDDMIDNCRNATVERLMIQRIDSRFNKLISEYKNYGDVLANLQNNLHII